MNTATLGASATTRKDKLIAAALTSQAAGLIMAVVVMAVFTIFLGKGPLYPVQVIGSTVFGESALLGFNIPAILAGLILHQTVALAWGIVFGIAAIALNTETPRAAIVTGVIVALISMTDTYIFVPHVMNSLHGVDIWNREVPIFWNWAAHIVFGLSFSFYPAILAKWLECTR